MKRNVSILQQQQQQQQQQQWRKYLKVQYKVVISVVVLVWIIYMLQKSYHVVPNTNDHHYTQYHLLRSMQEQQQQERCNTTDVVTTTRATTLLSDITTSIPNSNTQYCQTEFHRLLTTNMTTTTMALTKDDYERSIANVGNRYRILQFVTKLIHSSQEQQQQSSVLSSSFTGTAPTSSTTTTKGVTVLVCGASITIGHGVEPKEGRYLNLFENWLNTAYPIPTTPKNNNPDQSQEEEPEPDQHRVHFRGGHGANICAMAKRIKYMNLPNNIIPDLFVLEFAVNNYQAEDFSTYVDHKTDVFFHGFQDIVQCTELVIGRILLSYPNTAIVFLDLHTAIPNRKTAQSLHIGVAQHYQIPVLSYADMMMPDYYRLLDILQPYNYMIPNTTIFDTIQTTFPYPHGCSPCRLQDMTEQFRPDGCFSTCKLMQEGGTLSETVTCRTDSVHPCYVPMYAHDEVHLSKVGHGIARDILVHYVSTIVYDICMGHSKMYQPHVLPIHGGWIIGSDQAGTTTATTNDINMNKSYQRKIMTLSEFVFVRDVKYNFADVPILIPKNHTSGFEIITDYLGRKGWIAKKAKGNEMITFEITGIPIEKCYAVYITVLKSYKTVGTFNVSIYDHQQQKITKQDTIDCLWKPHISVPVDVQLTMDGSTDCTGHCDVLIITNPQITTKGENRGGNLIKITSLSARRCV